VLNKGVAVERLEKPWFADYEVLGMPQTLEPYPSIPTHTFLDRAAENDKKMGYVQMGCTMLYPEARDKADRLANALAAMGVAKGDRVATLLPTSIQFVLADHAISKAGAVHVPCSFLEPPDHLEHKFSESGPKVVFTLYEHLDMVDGLREKTGLEKVIVSRLEDFSHEPPAERPQLDEGMYWLTDLLESHPPLPPRIEFRPESDVETLLFTGGTTGLPKGCMLSHYNQVSVVTQNGWLSIVIQILKGNIAVLIGTPFFHGYGHCILHTMTSLGMMQLLLPDARDTGSMVEMIKEHHPVMAIGVPTQFMNLLDEEIKDLGIIGLSGSAALPPETQERFEQRGAGAIMEGYGLSEMSPTTHSNASALIRLFGGRKMVAFTSRLLRLPGQIDVMSRLIGCLGYKRMGRFLSLMLPRLSRLTAKRPKLKSAEKRATIGIPLPDIDVKITDVDTGEEITMQEMVKENRVGEMLLKGPQRMLGYWPEKGTGFDEEGYIHTGDVVRIDERGYFYIVDRAKDMIVVSGFKVYSREVDDVLYEHDAVAMAATIGLPDPERQGSERVKVFIQAKPGYSDKITEEEIIAYLRRKVPRYAVPREVAFIEEMPLTGVQKVNKKYLREMEMRKMDGD
jgi:acyl-CoA synthetase (AMP-forming)/AMP-acid ligase II